jgi:hypothetical protein
MAMLFRPTYPRGTRHAVLKFRLAQPRACKGGRGSHLASVPATWVGAPPQGCRSLLAEQLDHPTPADVWPRPAQVRENLCVGATAFFQRVGEHGEAGGAPTAVRGDSGADRSAAAGVCLGVRLAAFDKAFRKSSPCVPGAPRGAISADEPGRSVWCDGLRPLPGE